MIFRILEEKDKSVKLIDNGKQILNEEGEETSDAPDTAEEEAPENPTTGFFKRFNPEEDDAESEEIPPDDLEGDDIKKQLDDIYRKCGKKVNRNNRINIYLDTEVYKKHGELCTKFRVTENTVDMHGHTLYQIIDPETRQLGGYIERGWNLGPFGKSWIDKSSCVYGNAVVWSDSLIANNSVVYGTYSVRTVINGKHTVIDNSEVFGLNVGYSMDEGDVGNEDERRFKASVSVSITNSTVKSISLVRGHLTANNATILGQVQIDPGNVLIDNATVSEAAWLSGTAEVKSGAVVSGHAHVWDATVENKAVVRGGAVVYTPEWSTKDRTVISGEGVVLNPSKSRRYTTSILSPDQVPSSEPSYATLDDNGLRINPFLEKSFKKKNGKYIYWVPGEYILPQSEAEYTRVFNKRAKGIRVFGGTKWNTQKARDDFDDLVSQGRARKVGDELRADGKWSTLSLDPTDLPTEFKTSEFMDENGKVDYRKILTKLEKEGRLIPEIKEKGENKVYVHSSDWYKDHSDDWKDLKRKYLLSKETTPRKKKTKKKGFAEEPAEEENT